MQENTQNTKEEVGLEGMSEAVAMPSKKHTALAYVVAALVAVVFIAAIALLMQQQQGEQMQPEEETPAMVPIVYSEEELQAAMNTPLPDDQVITCDMQ